MTCRRTLQHVAEMVAGMVAGMVALGPLWPIDTTATATYAFVMATDMSVGMGAVMALRRQPLGRILTMAIAMYLPFMVLLVPYRNGLLGADAFLDLGHLLMLALMLGLAVGHTPLPRSADHRVGKESR